MIKEYIERKRAIVDACNSLELYPSEYAELENALNRIPAADVAEVRHGRWLCVDTDIEQFFLCNRCKKKEYWESNYCPNCGAKMNKDDGYCYLEELKEGVDNG